MDGNKRWSKKNNLHLKDGYIKGLNKINEIVDYCILKKIPNLSLYALSTENFKRDNVNIIFNIIEKNYINFVKNLNKKKSVQIRIIGEKDNLSKRLKDIFTKIENINISNPSLKLNILFNYGFNKEILSIVKKIVDLNSEKRTLINEELIHKYKYINNINDPEILIRTGGNQRLSNFILLNLTYTELYFIDTLWPDISTNELDLIFEKFEKIKKNYGL